MRKFLNENLKTTEKRRKKKRILGYFLKVIDSFERIYEVEAYFRRLTAHQDNIYHKF